MRIEEINLVGACELALTYPKQIQMILNKPVVIRCGRWCYTHKTLGNFYWARFADQGSSPDQWEIYPIANGNLVIKSLKDNKNLQVMPNGATKCENTSESQWENNTGESLWEQFGIEFKEGLYYIVSRHTDRVLQCDFFGHPNASNKNRSNWEALNIVPVDK